MRTRLLDATVQCLVSYGYSGTTTARVAEVAGVTRGAQVHHFGSKEDLVLAAIEHLAQQRTQSAMTQLEQVNTTADPMGAILDFLWQEHQGPIFVATLELWVAARTDAVLAQEIDRVEPIVNNALATAIAKLAPDDTSRRDLRNVVYTAMDALRGILLNSFFERDPARARRRWDRACANLRGIGADARS